MTTSVVIVDDHAIVRHGLRAILVGEPDLEVVADVADALTAIEAVRDHQPDVVVLDLAMPGMPGLEAINRLRDLDLNTGVVVLSMHSDDSYVIQALRNGALGYVVKNAGAAELLEAIRLAAVGRRYISPPLSPESMLASNQAADAPVTDPYDTLSPREREVLQMAADGLTNRDIADRLDISRRTVESHRASLMKKLRINSQAGLVRYAVSREGLGSSS